MILSPNPIILIGAPRSGTKMLRELLKLHPMITGPVYEKERIWCYGNREKMGKEIKVGDISPRIKNYIQSYFKKEFYKNHGKTIVDKSVNNCLRIDFVHKIFPESPIIHIVRDGRDAVCSIRERWKSPADWKYIIKNRAFPLEELPYFLKRQFKWYLEKVLGGRNHVKWWGPKFDDIQELINNYSLIEICSIQWKRCTEAALTSLENLEPESFIQVKYEDLVLDTTQTMERLCQFLDLSVDDHLKDKFREYVQKSSIGRWRIDLTIKELELLINHFQEILLKLEYQ